MAGLRISDPAEEINMKKGICVKAKYLETAAEAGFDHVLLAGFEVAGMSDDEFEDLCERALKCGIAVKGYNSYCRADLPIVGDGFDPDRTRAYARLLSERGKKLGITNIGIGAPSARIIPEGYDKDKAYDQYRQFCEITAQEAAPYGINVLIESLNKYQCNCVITLQEAVKIMQEIAMDNVKMVIDFAHMELNGEDFDSAADLLKYSADVHIAHNGENLSRPYLTEADNDMLAAVAAVLKKAGYDGTVTFEPQPEAEDYEARVKESFALMDRYF